MPDKQLPYYPSLSNLITLDSIPSSLDFVKNIADGIFNKIYYKDFQSSVSPLGESAFYSLSIITKKRLDFNLVFGMKFILNRDFDEDHISSFPVTVQYNWPIIAYIKRFNLDQFSFSPEEIFDMALICLNVSDERLVNEVINVFVNSTGDPIRQFVDDLNAELATDFSAPIPYPISENRIKELVSSINAAYGEGASYAVFAAYILSKADLSTTKNNLKQLFKRILPEDIEDYILRIIKPYALVTLESSASIEFPRKILKPWKKVPVDAVDELVEETDLSIKTYFDFAKGLFYADTEAGIGYNVELAGTLYPPYSEIGNTGLLIQIQKLKLDLSKKRNIPEVDAYGYPNDFIGVYADALSVTLPPKWFSKSSTHQTTMRIAGYNLLIGSGGVNGTFALEAVPISNGDGPVTSFFGDYFTFQFPITAFEIDEENEFVRKVINDNNELLIYINGLYDKNQYLFTYPLNIIKTNDEVVTINSHDEFRELVNSTVSGDNNYLWLNLGKSDTKSWSLGFRKFDISFYHGQVTSSHVQAALEIKKFKKVGEEANPQPTRIELLGEWESSENFKLTASFVSGLSISLFGSIILTLQTAELGREGKDFFIGADTKLKFPNDNTAIGKIFKGKEIDLPAIRIYSNGRFEITGGIGFIPTSFTLPLEPVEMSVTGIHLGSTQREFGGKMRNYNYIGFDGALNVDPIGLDIMGNGIKYYYTVDNDDFGNTGDRFLHITTLEIDLIIPGNASEEQAIAIIKGSLTIPDPGVSSEFGGSVSVKIPRAHIAGAAYMKLNPKNKSFLVSAALEFPGTPIPLGPIGIYGFKGLIGKKYVADKKAVPGLTDTSTWYDYYVASEKGVNEKKFRDPSQTGDYTNPFSVGIGASIATMSDGGRAASLRAMMLLSMPSMFAVDAGLAILSERLGLIESDNRTPPFYAFLIIGDSSLEFGAGANYKVPTSSGWFMEIQG